MAKVGCEDNVPELGLCCEEIIRARSKRPVEAALIKTKKRNSELSKNRVREVPRTPAVAIIVPQCLGDEERLTSLVQRRSRSAVSHSNQQ